MSSFLARNLQLFSINHFGLKGMSHTSGINPIAILAGFRPIDCIFGSAPIVFAPRLFETGTSNSQWWNSVVKGGHDIPLGRDCIVSFLGVIHFVPAYGRVVVNENRAT